MKLPNILIAGKSGSGKSSSLRNLNRDTTWVVDLQNKVFPFPRPFKYHYHIPNDYRLANDWGKILSQFREVMYLAANSADCSSIIVEDFTKFDEALLEYQKTTQTGWDVFGGHNKYVLERLNEFKFWPMPIVWICHDEIIEIETPDPNRPMRRAAVSVYGKKWEGLVEKEFEVVLFTHQTVDRGKPKYWFKTNNIAECSAKTPMGMFDELLIDNDLQMVFERMVEYYA